MVNKIRLTSCGQTLVETVTDETQASVILARMVAGLTELGRYIGYGCTSCSDALFACCGLTSQCTPSC